MIPLRMPERGEEAKPPTLLRQVLWFGLHLVAVYLIVWFIAPWLAGLIYRWVLPRLASSVDVSGMEFLFSHVFAWTFIPGLIVGLINSRHKHRVAVFVWVVPAAILVFKIFTFSTSVFNDYWSEVFHYYFGGGFLVPEFHSYSELFSLAGRPDLIRGMAQLHITGAFYAGIAYSLAAFLSPRLRWQEREETTIPAEV